MHPLLLLLLPELLVHRTALSFFLLRSQSSAFLLAFCCRCTDGDFFVDTRAIYRDLYIPWLARQSMFPDAKRVSYGTFVSIWRKDPRCSQILTRSNAVA
jgi:hypothetical protein